MYLQTQVLFSFFYDVGLKPQDRFYRFVKIFLDLQIQKVDHAIRKHH